MTNTLEPIVKNKKEKLEDYLLKPAQRLEYYLNFIEDLLQFANKIHPTYSSFLDHKTQLSEFLKGTNQGKILIDSIAKMIQIQSLFEWQGDVCGFPFIFFYKVHL